MSVIPTETAAVWSQCPEGHYESLLLSERWCPRCRQRCDIYIAHVSTIVAESLYAALREEYPLDRIFG